MTTEKVTRAPRSGAPAVVYFTSKSLVPAAWPLSQIVTVYLPAGHGEAFTMWNSVCAGPVGAIAVAVESTVCPV